MLYCVDIFNEGGFPKHFFGICFIVSIFSCEGGCSNGFFIGGKGGGGRDNALFDLFRIFFVGGGG